MDNYLPLGTVFTKVLGLLEATAKHMEAVAAYESSLVDHTREALLASTIVKQRNELAAGMGDYLALAPESVKSTWLQYTSDADANKLLAQLERTRSVPAAIVLLDAIDEAVSDEFAICGRQEHPEHVKQACEWAVAMLDREKERRATAVTTANDI